MANTYLTRTPSSSSNRQTWTWSAWIKLGALGTDRNLFGAYANAADNFKINIADTDQVSMRFYNNTEYQLGLNRKFRDTSAWYHLVFTVDTTLASGGDRFKIYVNGVRETSFAAANDPTLDLQMTINEATATQIGRFNTGSYFDGAMSHIHFIDGTAYDASAFGETDATTGEWEAKTSPSVTYGTNGFFILKDGNGITDQSGEGNDFTLGGGTLTDLKDNPENVFATMNSLGAYRNQPTMTNGNLTLTGTGSGTTWNNTVATLGATQGKWYYEFKITGGSQFLDIMVGIINADKANNPTTNLYTQNGSCYYYGNDGGEMRQDNGETFNDYGAFAQNDIIGIAYDLDTYKFNVYKNGTQIVTDFALSSNFQDGGIIIPSILVYEQSVGSANFGNGYFGTTAVTTNSGNGYSGAEGSSKFNYTVPTGYSALNTKGLNL